MSALSDDDYDHDATSNPGQGSLESSFDEFTFSAARELFASQGDRQAAPKLVRIYVDGSFDLFDVGHALQLQQAKLAFSFVHLIVGVFSDEVLLQNGYNWPEVERLDLVRHCRWVNEVTKDALWVTV
ncbi:hypothetical protein BYT27DRAFT_7238013 [Phlegmacium glaucopus]|nr:hypothetical protein BYT27DRAFT_7238013 [Phlegmacium glaucopus]